jgi:uracil-DNA glycosylase
MEEHAAGKAFTPTFMDLFKSFRLCSHEGVRVIFINTYPNPIADQNNGLALSCPISVEKLPYDVVNFQTELEKVRTAESETSSQDLSYLAKQGVMLLNFSMTTSVNNLGSHLELWRPAFQKLIADIAYKTMKTIFVFIGPETEYLQKAVRKGQYKFFLPDVRGGQPWDTDGVFKKINSLLEKQEKHPINW